MGWHAREWMTFRLEIDIHFCKDYPSGDLPPSCRDAARVIEAGGAAPMTLSCTDPNGDAVAFGVASQPSSGVLGAASFSPTGSLTYIPGAGFTGIDQFTFRATTANGGESDPARVIVLVQPPQAAVVRVKHHRPVGANRCDHRLQGLRTHAVYPR